MINPDDFEPKKSPSSRRRDLTPMSVNELHDYIAELETEIERANTAIAKKEAHRSGIEALFGKS